MQRLTSLLVAGSLVVASSLEAQRAGSGPVGADGEIVARAPCAPMRPYAAERAAQAAARQGGTLAALPDSAEYTRLARGAACERVTYGSDGLRVVALLVRPAETAGRRFPLVVFNHGNTADRGALPERVALWPERLTVPLLIMHDTADDRVPPASALDLAARLQRLGRPYELVMFAGGRHDLTAQRAEVERRVMAWFDAHRTP